MLTFFEWLNEARRSNRQNYSRTYQRPSTQSKFVQTQRGGYVSDIKADQSRSGLGTTSMDYQTRVSRGKGVEEKIKNALADHGIAIVGSGDYQQDVIGDIDLGIDGYWNGKQSVQIKYRDTGDDVLYELIKPHNISDSLMVQYNKNPGRDSRSEAEYYVVLNRTGDTIYKVPVKFLRVALQQAVREYGDKPLQRPWRSKAGISLNPTMDRRSGTPKVVAFIPPSLFQSVSQSYPVHIKI